MRGPFNATGDGASRDAAERPAWASLPPLDTAPAALQVTAPTRSFLARLAGRHSPALALEPLGHDVSLTAPTGIVSGLARSSRLRVETPALESRWQRALRRVRHPGLFRTFAEARHDDEAAEPNVDGQLEVDGPETIDAVGEPYSAAPAAAAPAAQTSVARAAAVAGDDVSNAPAASGHARHPARPPDTAAALPLRVLRAAVSAPAAAATPLTRADLPLRHDPPPAVATADVSSEIASTSTPEHAQAEPAARRVRRLGLGAPLAGAALSRRAGEPAAIVDTADSPAPASAAADEAASAGSPTPRLVLRRPLATTVAEPPAEGVARRAAAVDAAERSDVPADDAQAEVQADERAASAGTPSPASTMPPQTVTPDAASADAPPAADTPAAAAPLVGARTPLPVARVVAAKSPATEATPHVTRASRESSARSIDAEAPARPLDVPRTTLVSGRPIAALLRTDTRLDRLADGAPDPHDTDERDAGAPTAASALDVAVPAATPSPWQVARAGKHDLTGALQRLDVVAAPPPRLDVVAAAPRRALAAAAAFAGPLSTAPVFAPGTTGIASNVARARGAAWVAGAEAAPAPMGLQRVLAAAPRARAHAPKLAPAADPRWRAELSLPPRWQPLATETAEPSLPLAVAPAPMVARAPDERAPSGADPVAASAFLPPALLAGSSPLQRAAETAAPSTMSASGSGDAAGGPHDDLEALAGRLYDRIRRRLRNELLLDRERSGVLTG